MKETTEAGVAGAAPARLHFHLPLEPSRLLRARERVRDYLHQQLLEADLIDDVVLALEEAMTNAVRHSGAAEDLEVALRFEGADLLLEVRDRGQGFDVGSFDPDALPDRLASGGRGLFLMAKLMDELHLGLDDGLAVRMAMRGVLEARTAREEFDRALTPSSPAGTPSHRKTRLRSMLEEIDEGFAALDWEYRHVHVNAAACRLVGLTRVEMLGRTPFELWPQIGGSELDRGYRAAMELGRPSIIEHETRAHGWLELRLYPTAAGLSVYFRDIAERKRQELEREALLEELRQQRRDLDRAQAVSHTGSWRLDLQHDALLWSAETYRMFDLPFATPLTYEAFLAFVHPDDRAYVDREWTAALHGVPYNIEHRIVVGETVKWVHERAELEFDTEGRLVGGFGTVVDISARKRAEQEQQQLAAELGAQTEKLQHLNEAQRDIATTLQANFLHPLPDLVGWEFGLATRVASAADLVGGDFHDVFILSDEQLVVLLGDVEGKGIAAAGMTETVHAAARALAVTGPSPSRVLERLNRLLLLQESPLVTALLVLLQRKSGELSIACAGHPAPLHLRCEGSVEPLSLEPGPPLGAFEESHYAPSTAELAPGEALLLYTDGVIDARREGVFFGPESLLATARRLAGASAQQIADGVREAVTDYADSLRDDLHVLVIRREAHSP